jgi:hypothetical protein
MSHPVKLIRAVLIISWLACALIVIFNRTSAQSPATPQTTAPNEIIIPEQVDFDDYRDVAGMKMPFTIRVSAIDPNYSVVRKFTEIKLNVPIDPKRFNKPV